MKPVDLQQLGCEFLLEEMAILDSVVTVGETCQILKKSRRVVQRYCDDGRLIYRRVEKTGQRLISLTSVVLFQSVERMEPPLP